MLCDECREREAVLSLIELSNGVSKETHLCKECASRRGNVLKSMTGSSFLSNLLESMMGISMTGAPPIDHTKTNVKCLSCGQTYDDFLQEGKFGCPACYRTYQFLLDSYLKKIQGGYQHTGKTPLFSGETLELPQPEILGAISKEDGQEAGGREKIAITVDKDSALEELRAALRRAIDREEYEEAARIRDLIKAGSGEV